MKKSFKIARLAVLASSIALFSTLALAHNDGHILNRGGDWDGGRDYQRTPTIQNTPSDGSVLNQNSANADSIVTTQDNRGAIGSDNHTFSSSGAISADINGAGAQSSKEKNHGVGVNVAAVTAVTTSLQAGMMNSSGSSVGSTVNVGNVGGETGNASSNSMNISNKTMATPRLNNLVN